MQNAAERGDPEEGEYWRPTAEFHGDRFQKPTRGPPSMTYNSDGVPDFVHCI
jgi:hypothetical protein